MANHLHILRIQTQKLEEHEQWRKEIKQTQVLIKKEQDKTLAEGSFLCAFECERAYVHVNISQQLPC